MSKFGAVFIMVLLACAAYAVVQRQRPTTVATVGSRVAANERLTALNGAFLFALLFAIAVTVLFIRALLPTHYLVGFALIPPLALKLFTTGQRFVRYYSADREFRLAGPPPLLLRFVIAPALIASTVAVMATGVELWAFADRFGSWWVSAHTVSAVVFMGALLVHLLGHLRRSGEALAEEATREPREGVLTRRSVLIGCAVLGGVLAVASLAYATPFGVVGGGV